MSPRPARVPGARRSPAASLSAPGEGRRAVPGSLAPVPKAGRPNCPLVPMRSAHHRDVVTGVAACLGPRSDAGTRRRPPRLPSPDIGSSVWAPRALRAARARTAVARGPVGARVGTDLRDRGTLGASCRTAQRPRRHGRPTFCRGRTVNRRLKHEIHEIIPGPMIEHAVLLSIQVAVVVYQRVHSLTG